FTPLPLLYSPVEPHTIHTRQRKFTALPTGFTGYPLTRGGKTPGRLTCVRDYFPAGHTVQRRTGCVNIVTTWHISCERRDASGRSPNHTTLSVWGEVEEGDRYKAIQRSENNPRHQRGSRGVSCLLSNSLF